MDAHIKQLTQQQMQMMKALNDKEADREIERTKIAQDFEAKILKVVADMDTKTASTHEKAMGTIVTHSHAVADLGIKVTELIHKISGNDNPDGDGQGRAAA
jgi:hypothetical protein